jgi:IS30 family transposase
MSKLNLEARMTIQTLVRQQLAQREIARLLGVTEGAVRYQIRRMTEGKVDGRSPP